jgi:ectoine hydroxylase-related dioxygenase (phytanoyl-CoA dioxygenase family)
MQTISRDQVDYFNENGFLRLDNVFDPKTVAWQSQELERLMQEWATQGPGWRGPWRKAYMTAEEDERARLDIMSDLPSYSEAYYRAVTSERLVGAVADLLGTSVEYHHSVLHAKGPEMGTPFPLHQDYPFYEHEGPGYIDALLHIDAATMENGCLKFIPGSHKLGKLEHVGAHDSKDTRPHLPVDEYPVSSATPVPANAGDVVFMSYLTIHGSEPNRTDEWRRLVRVGYRDPQNLQVSGHNNGVKGLVVRGKKRNMATTAA